MAKVRWTGTNQIGETAAWAGSGIGDLVSMQDEVNGFGVGTETKGPAVLVEFTSNGEIPRKYQAWLSPAEVEQVQ